MIGGVSMVDNARTRGGTSDELNTDASLSLGNSSQSTNAAGLPGTLDFSAPILRNPHESNPNNPGTSTNAASTPKNSSTKAELEYVQIYCPRKDQWTIHPIGRKLARLACALYKDYVYVVSNNVSPTR